MSVTIEIPPFGVNGFRNRLHLNNSACAFIAHCPVKNGTDLQLCSTWSTWRSSAANQSCFARALISTDPHLILMQQAVGACNASAHVGLPTPGFSPCPALLALLLFRPPHFVTPLYRPRPLRRCAFPSHCPIMESAKRGHGDERYSNGPGFGH